MTPAEIRAIAAVCHEANRALQATLGEKQNPEWAALDHETKASAIDGVEAALHGTTPEQSHENWLRFKTEHGWVYGPEKDFEAKTHPCMVPYAELPEEQKQKDHLFTAIVDALKK